MRRPGCITPSAGSARYHRIGAPDEPAAVHCGRAAEIPTHDRILEFEYRLARLSDWLPPSAAAGTDDAPR